MISCIAIDDEPLALEVLKKYILKLPELNLLFTFSNALEAKDYLEKNFVSLLFLDTEMPEINGMDLYKSLSVKPMVIFTTADSTRAVEAFELDAIDYLLKPFNYSRFQTAVGKAFDRKKHREKEEAPAQHLYVHSDYKMVKISFNEIIYIESLDDHVKINTGAHSYLTLLSMKKLLEKLPKKTFLRIHRSYIISAEKILFMQYRKVGLINNIELPIGDTYRSAIAKLKNTNKNALNKESI